MSMKPPPSTSKQPISLAKQATGFAVTLGISLGLCAVGQNVDVLVVISLVVAAVCVLGLLSVGITAIVRAFRVKPRH